VSTVESDCKILWIFESSRISVANLSMECMIVPIQICTKGDRIMDWLSLIESVGKVLEPIAVIAMAVVLFLWNQNYREAKNAVIDLKEERLKEKEDQLKSKEEQIKTKDEQIKAVEKQNEVLKLLTAEMLQKNFSAMKTMFEGQIANLEIEKEEAKRKYDKAISELIELQARSGTKTEEIDSLTKEIESLNEKLKQKEIGIDTVRLSEQRYHEMRFKDAYGPVAAWLLLFKSRATSATEGEHMVERKAELDNRGAQGKAKAVAENLRKYLDMLDEFEGKGPIYMRTEEAIANLAAKYKDDPEALKKKMKELESEAWEDCFDMTISEAIRWASSNIQKLENQDDPEEKNGKS
jgi:hypothetical protein